jgi:hypothetical protein
MIEQTNTTNELMKITATKVKKILVDKYGWGAMQDLDEPIFIELIKDTMKVINEILVSQGCKQFIK